jgi:hypothetical protein
MNNLLIQNNGLQPYGKKAAELFYQEAQQAPTRQIPLQDAEQAIAQGARRREGNLIDNIVYKQEELIIDLYLANTLNPVMGFYNDFSKQAEQTGHMQACQAFGHFPVLDIVYEEEKVITQRLLDAGMLVQREMKAADAEKQLAQSARLYSKLQPSLQLQFVLELLERAKMEVPAQYKFIDSCLALYKRIPGSIARGFDTKGELVADIVEQAEQVYAGFDPVLLCPYRSA